MFKYTKFKIVKLGDNPHWLLRGFINRELDGRISCAGNHQIKHPKYSNWFDVPKDLIEIQLISKKD